MENVILWRRRYIPDELICLKNDEIVSIDAERVVTKWNVLTPRHDFTNGASCYFIKEGFKISKFLDDNNKLLYWYCDIIETQIDDKKENYTFNDLLIDVIVYENGFVKVVDLDEVGKALEENIMEKDLIIKATNRVNKLLNIIYTGKFDEYTKYIEGVWLWQMLKMRILIRGIDRE